MFYCYESEINRLDEAYARKQKCERGGRKKKLNIIRVIVWRKTKAKQHYINAASLEAK